MTPVTTPWSTADRGMRVRWNDRGTEAAAMNIPACSARLVSGGRVRLRGAMRPCWATDSVSTSSCRGDSHRWSPTGHATSAPRPSRAPVSLVDPGVTRKPGSGASRGRARRSPGDDLSSRAAVHDRLDLGEAADGCPPAGVFNEPDRCLHLLPHRPRSERECAQFTWRYMLKTMLLRCPPVPVDAVDVRRHDQQVGSYLAGKQLAREILIDHRLDTDEDSIGAGQIHRGDATPSRADHNDVLVE